MDPELLFIASVSAGYLGWFALAEYSLKKKQHEPPSTRNQQDFFTHLKRALPSDYQKTTTHQEDKQTLQPTDTSVYRPRSSAAYETKEDQQK